MVSSCCCPVIPSVDNRRPRPFDRTATAVPREWTATQRHHNSTLSANCYPYCISTIGSPTASKNNGTTGYSEYNRLIGHGILGCLGLSGEQEFHILVGQLSVNSGESLELIINLLDILGVKIDFEEARAVSSESGSLANDLGRVNEIAEDGRVDGGQSAGARANLTGVVARICGREDSALGEDDDVFAREFLLQFADQSSLKLLKALVKTVRNEDNNTLLATGQLNLLGRGEEEIAELSAHLFRGDFQFNESLGDLLFELGWLLVLLLHNLLSSEVGGRSRHWES
jgi:hypothetical protein